jgi:hypothetical protein
MSDSLFSSFGTKSRKTFLRTHSTRKMVEGTTLGMDMTPRYAPKTVQVRGYSNVKATGYKVHPPGTHHGPIVSSMTALEIETPYGSRWFGVESAYINSQLRAVVVGTNRRDEVRMKWLVVPKKFR